ncbi:GntR family transcriptional regulator [Saccharobesus litoralis]|uniref:GntR family transcriptional regulator n=1 Tax=Saccharobesus litoralis TaxID=2172099 RepID=A0A2S0VPG3_9ALTE|nr:GntR family transcriptional regulator [Saccharobesus litoralis]AWB66089.1 GntR family transcriptional regulator [Saccharobesus litoralis]
MKKRTYFKIGELIKEDILQARYRIGGRLPSERILAERFKVTRAIVRDAITMLELQGLVEARKGSGVYVIAFPMVVKEQSSAKQFHAFSKPYSTSLHAADIFQARQVVECQVAELAAMNMTKPDLIKVKNVIKQELTCKSHELDDSGFYISVAQASQNTVLVDAVQRLLSLYQSSRQWPAMRAKLFDEKARLSWIAEHQAIYSALQCKQPSLARNAMWQHLQNSKSLAEGL